jgi:hypothetical protein
VGYTRRQFINAAMTEIGIADYDFDISPEQYQTAARRLDSMLLEWNARGLRLGMNTAASIDGTQLDIDVGLPDIANEAVIMNLAIKIAPSFGKQVMPDTKQGAKMALNTVMARFAEPIPMQLGQNTPLGAGNKPWRYGNPFVRPPVEYIDPNTDSTFGIETT